MISPEDMIGTIECKNNNHNQNFESPFQNKYRTSEVCPYQNEQNSGHPTLGNHHNENISNQEQPLMINNAYTQNYRHYIYDNRLSVDHPQQHQMSPSGLLSDVKSSEFDYNKNNLNELVIEGSNCQGSNVVDDNQNNKYLDVPLASVSIERLENANSSQHNPLPHFDHLLQNPFNMIFSSEQPLSVLSSQIVPDAHSNNNFTETPLQQQLQDQQTVQQEETPKFAKDINYMINNDSLQFQNKIEPSLTHNGQNESNYQVDFNNNNSNNNSSNSQSINLQQPNHSYPKQLELLQETHQHQQTEQIPVPQNQMVIEGQGYQRHLSLTNEIFPADPLLHTLCGDDRVGSLCQVVVNEQQLQPQQQQQQQQQQQSIQIKEVDLFQQQQQEEVHNIEQTQPTSKHQFNQNFERQNEFDYSDKQQSEILDSQLLLEQGQQKLQQQQQLHSEQQKIEDKNYLIQIDPFQKQIVYPINQMSSSNKGENQIQYEFSELINGYTKINNGGNDNINSINSSSNYPHNNIALQGNPNCNVSIEISHVSPNQPINPLISAEQGILAAEGEVTTNNTGLIPINSFVDNQNSNNSNLSDQILPSQFQGSHSSPRSLLPLPHYKQPSDSTSICSSYLLPHTPSHHFQQIKQENNPQEQERTIQIQKQQIAAENEMAPPPPMSLMQQDQQQQNQQQAAHNSQFYPENIIVQQKEEEQEIVPSQYKLYDNNHINNTCMTSSFDIQKPQSNNNNNNPNPPFNATYTANYQKTPAICEKQSYHQFPSCSSSNSSYSDVPASQQNFMLKDRKYNAYNNIDQSYNNQKQHKIYFNNHNHHHQDLLLNSQSNQYQLSEEHINMADYAFLNGQDVLDRIHIRAHDEHEYKDIIQNTHFMVESLTLNHDGHHFKSSEMQDAPKAYIESDGQQYHARGASNERLHEQMGEYEYHLSTLADKQRGTQAEQQQQQQGTYHQQNHIYSGNQIPHHHSQHQSQHYNQSRNAYNNYHKQSSSLYSNNNPNNSSCLNQMSKNSYLQSSNGGNSRNAYYGDYKPKQMQFSIKLGEELLVKSVIEKENSENQQQLLNAGHLLYGIPEQQISKQTVPHCSINSNRGNDNNKNSKYQKCDGFNNEDEEDDDVDDQQERGHMRNEEEESFEKSSNLTSEQWFCIQQLQKHKKKNVAKNIMTAFKNFIANPMKFGYSQQQIATALSCYNKSKKIEESFDEMQNKFLKYIVKKKFNHYTIKLLIQHPNYGEVFEYFLKQLSDFWLEQSKVHDIEAHLAMINFLKEAYNDIEIINQLKKYDKRKY